MIQRKTQEKAENENKEKIHWHTHENIRGDGAKKKS